MTAEPVNREALAREVYTAMTWAAEHALNGGGPTAWVPGGNSYAQEEARRVADRWLSRPDAERAEPVAWRSRHVSYVGWTLSHQKPPRPGLEIEPLYAAPPPPIPSSTGGEGISAEMVRLAVKDQGYGHVVHNGLLTVSVDLSLGINLERFAKFLNAALSRPQPVAETVEALTIEDRESLEFLRIGMSRFEGRNGSIRIDTATELPLILKGLAALAARPSAHGEAG